DDLSAGASPAGSSGTWNSPSQYSGVSPVNPQMAQYPTLQAGYIDANAATKVEVGTGGARVRWRAGGRGVHQRIWHEAKSALGQLMQNPEDGEAFAKLNEASALIVGENRARQFPEAMFNSYVIDIKTFMALFKTAAPFLARLRKSHADIEARTKLDALNEQLKDFNRLHSYPSD
ncbi:MAG: hypothetical protein M1823_007161, partial [Watsoniomyces obsoletus]